MRVAAAEGRVEYFVRTLSEFGSLDEIADLVVSRRDDVDIRLGDIAAIYRSHRERQVTTRVNGRQSVELEIYKEADANIVAVARLLHSRLFGLPEQRLMSRTWTGKWRRRKEKRSGTRGKRQASRKRNTRTRCARWSTCVHP